MEQLRMVETPQGAISYVLIKKRIKNLNLRLERGGQVVLSVPVRCSADYADRFVQEKAAWLLQKQSQIRNDQVQPGPEMSREESFRVLKAALDQVYPMVEPFGVAYPVLKLRSMKSQWGNCHWAQGYITLNTALARCPEELRQYVALHELVHFLHHNHGAGFYGEMDRLMPNWRALRAELKRYVGILDQ